MLIKQIPLVIWVLDEVVRYFDVQQAIEHICLGFYQTQWVNNGRTVHAKVVRYQRVKPIIRIIDQIQIRIIRVYKLRPKLILALG